MAGKIDIENMEGFSKYEVARILGARGLQIAMNAPLLIKISKEDLERVKFDALKIAEIEFESGVLPISIKRPFPKRREEKLKRVKEQQVSEEKIQQIEKEEEDEIAKEGEIMGLVNREDEIDEDDSGDSEEE